MPIPESAFAHLGDPHLPGTKSLPTSYAILKPTLPYIADEQLPRDAAEAQRLAATAQGMGENINRLIGAMADTNARDKETVKQLYEIVDRLRVSAKDAQSYTDRSLATSHLFLPMIESVYPCGGADPARNMAHGVHLQIGKTKDVIGNPKGINAEKVQGMLTPAEKDAKRLSRGAADLLQDMERKLGRIVGITPGGLHQCLPPMEDASLPPDLTVFIANAVERSISRARARKRAASFQEVARPQHQSEPRCRRTSVIARFL